MASLLPNAEQQFIDANGAPLAAGTIDTYIPGTTTQKQTWQDAAETILNTNPIVLDAAGRAIIYGTGTYRTILKDALGNLIWDRISTDISSLGTSAYVAVTDQAYGARGDGQTDDSHAFTASMAEVVTGGNRSIYVPEGTYLLNTQPNIGTGRVCWKMEGGAKTTGSASLANGATVVSGPDDVAAHHIARLSDTDHTPVFQVDSFESLSMAAGTFYDAFVFNHERHGGTGHRGSVTAQITVGASSLGEQLCGLAGFGFLNGGAGSIFGANSFARIGPLASTNASACSFEADTDVQIVGPNVVSAKVGLNIVDVKTSLGSGLNIDCGLNILKQPVGVVQITTTVGSTVASCSSTVGLVKGQMIHAAAFVRAGTFVTDITPNISINLSVPAIGSGLVAAAFSALGYKDGILFGSDLVAGEDPALNCLIRTGAQSTLNFTGRGIDFRSGQFGIAAIDLRGAAGAASMVTWNSGEAGTIMSLTGSRGPVMQFGLGSVQITDVQQLNVAFSVNTDVPSINMFIPGVGLRQVTAGAPNSGGGGLRQLTVAN